MSCQLWCPFCGEWSTIISIVHRNRGQILLGLRPRIPRQVVCTMRLGSRSSPVLTAMMRRSSKSFGSGPWSFWQEMNKRARDSRTCRVEAIFLRMRVLYLTSYVVPSLLPRHLVSLHSVLVIGLSCRRFCTSHFAHVAAIIFSRNHVCGFSYYYSLTLPLQAAVGAVSHPTPRLLGNIMRTPRHDLGHRPKTSYKAVDHG